jgi:DNA polymerase-3 subunit epsilon
LQALAYLAGRLADEHDVDAVRLRLQAAGMRARLDLVWAGGAMSTETVMNWQMDPMRSGEDATPLTLRDVVERHGGEFWFERERTRHEAFFRFLLPRSDSEGRPEAAPAAGGDGRPEFYDFDLFQTSAQARAFDERDLAELSYTVFDTETTGLNPSEGDEILQIGALRIVNGRLLRHESFEQLVDPRRSLDPASAAIHCIRPEALAGQPTILEVLPVFHAFARDTVLVAHNAAFDMRFLQLKEAASGIRFDQPVLDTLLLSAWLQPNQESHRLEAIAERMGVAVTGRHTALGDATGDSGSVLAAGRAAPVQGRPHPGTGARGSPADVSGAAALLTRPSERKPAATRAFFALPAPTQRGRAFLPDDSCSPETRRRPRGWGSARARPAPARPCPVRESAG